MKKNYITPDAEVYVLQNPLMTTQLSVSGKTDDEARSIKFGTYLWDEQNEEDEEEQTTLF